jgi:peptide/nickel transport system permease protein
VALAGLLLKRLGLSLITLWLLSVIVFAGGQLLPGDIARAMLGPLADPRAVAAFNAQFGLDRPLLVQYGDWIARFLTGDMGQSYAFRSDVAPFIIDALGYSLKLAAVALVLVVPLSIGGGVWAALHAGRTVDRVVSIIGLSATVLPEFVTGIVLILIFGVWLDWLPITAAWPTGAGPLTQVYYLILPSLPLVLSLFGYLARMTRAGMVDALAADYTRTAVLKGLPQRTVLWRHVLRNALTPTITAISTQLGTLIGGLVVIDILFRYPGVGSLIFTAARQKDFPMLQAGVLTLGIIYALAALLADVLAGLLNPRVRYGVGQ